MDYHASTNVGWQDEQSPVESWNVLGPGLMLLLVHSSLVSCYVKNVGCVHHYLVKGSSLISSSLKP